MVGGGPQKGGASWSCRDDPEGGPKKQTVPRDVKGTRNTRVSWARRPSWRWLSQCSGAWCQESRMRPPVPPLCLTLSKRAPNHCLASQALSPWEETLPLGLRGGSQSHSNQSLGLWVVEIHLWAEPTSQDTGQLWMCRRICPEPDGEGAGASQTQAQVPGGRAAGIPRGAALLGLWALSLYGSTGLRIWWCLWAASARLTRGSPEPHATREGGQQEPRTKSSHGDGICVT